MNERPRVPRRALLTCTAALLCAVALGLGAAAAYAAPTEPTLSVAQLQARLAAAPGGTLDGYFKTVLKGAEITEVPVTVQAVVPDSIL